MTKRSQLQNIQVVLSDTEVVSRIRNQAAMLAVDLTEAKKRGIEVTFNLAPDADGVFKVTDTIRRITIL
jgi:hypothetical protein